MSDDTFSPPLIRAMDPSDLDRIIEIDRRVLGRSRPEYWEMKLETLKKGSQVPSLVAELDDNVIGFIIGDVSQWEYGVPENIGWIDTIGVDPDFQRKGIAKTLFREMTEKLKQMGVDSIITFVKRRDWVLLKFFNHMGFQKGDMINLELNI